MNIWAIGFALAYGFALASYGHTCNSRSFWVLVALALALGWSIYGQPA